jgi:hypothetical protein
MLFNLMIKTNCKTLENTNLRNARRFECTTSSNYSQKYFNLPIAYQSRIEREFGHIKNQSTVALCKLTAPAQRNLSTVGKRSHNILQKIKYPNSSNFVLPDVTSFLDTSTKEPKSLPSKVTLQKLKSIQEEPLCHIDVLRRAIKYNKIGKSLLNDNSSLTRLSTSQYENICIPSKLNAIPRVATIDTRQPLPIVNYETYLTTKAKTKSVFDFASRKENIPCKLYNKIKNNCNNNYEIADDEHENEVDSKGFSPWKTHGAAVYDFLK